MEKTPLCSACHAHFMTKWGDDDVITLVADEECAFRECPRSECLSEPAEPTEPTIFRVIFDLEIDGVLVPVDASGTFDPKAMRYEGWEPLRCYRTDGPQWVEVLVTDEVRTALTARAVSDWRAIDWEADRAWRMKRDEEDADAAFNEGWDAYSW
jgi:hypothetical protein